MEEMEKVFHEEGIETEILDIGNKDIRGCVACYTCMEKGKCVFDDIVNESAAKFEACDGLVIASPVYYASANATLIAYLDRLFYSTHFDKTMKVGASVVAARRGGLSATFDELNKYFTISGMPVASKPVLEQYPWKRTTGSLSGCGRTADNAYTCKKYDILNEEYQTWKRSIWTAGKRSKTGNKFYTMIYSHQMMSHEKGRIYSLSYKKDSRNEISNPFLRNHY